MTITLTVEEIKEYQDKVERHIQMQLQKNLLSSLPTKENIEFKQGAFEWIESEINRANAFLNENPIPKLIPTA